jgi:AAA+ ATPase superfamily predicted ATPase
MFIGRKNELSSLEKCYARDAFQFAVIYGRRRVGKSTLINEFCRDKKSIYNVAIQSTAKENLEILSAQILASLAPGAPRNPFQSFREAVEYVFERAKTERIIFTIDEYPYFAESDKSASSVLQAAIDRHQSESKLFLILCGSSMSFMENQVLGYKSPLYGRRTSQYKLLPFDYFESSEMVSTFSPEEKIIIYSITGGIPEYISRVDKALPLRENIQELFFNPSGRLFEEPTNLLKQELKMPETYNAIIAAIAGGSSKLNEIATKVGIETSQCSKMLSSLASLGLVRKEIPITETKSRKSTYALDDWMFIFWYRFVLPDISRITAGFGNDVCDELFEDYIINAHIGRAFEVCCKQYMWRAMKGKLLPFSFKKIGRWWGNNPKTRREEEIDFIAFSGDSAIFGECKWTNSPMDIEVLEALKAKSELLHYKSRWYWLFAKSGFSERLRKEAKMQDNVRLITSEDMLDV